MPELSVLREAYTRFYDIRNHPTEKTEFENWTRLSDKNIAAWCERLKTQAKLVKSLIDDLKDHKSDRGYHEMRSYFFEDYRDLSAALAAKGHTLEIE